MKVRVLKEPHSQSTEETANQLDVNPEKGLNGSEVKRRREEHGPNRLPEKEETSPFKIFLKQFKDFLILILFLAAGISFYAGQMTNGYIILAVILFNAIMGFLQEYRAQKAVQAIKGMVKHKAKVLRDEEQQEVEADQVVMGDVILLEEGQSVPADGHLFASNNLNTDEASLTGESEPVNKSTEPLKKGAELADRENMVWKGTHVVKGSGKAIVTGIGDKTEIGKIAQSLKEMEKTDSNFRKKTDRLAQKMAIIAICTSAIVFAIGYFYRGFDFQQILLVTIATMVSSIPEGLPVVISIVLAIGANRMAKRNAIIREFTATEVLGSVSTILTDKTGTITQSILTVKHLFTGNRQEYKVEGEGHELQGKLRQEEKEVDIDQEDDALSRSLLIARFGNKARISEKPEQQEEQNHNEEETEEKQPTVKGDPTEAALRVLGEKTAIAEQGGYQGIKTLEDLPFNAEQKFRAKVVQLKEGPDLLLVTGAPERILERCTQIIRGDQAEELTEEQRDELMEKNDEWADQALRVISLAYREWDTNGQELEAEAVEELTWAGMVGMIDPARPEVEDAIADCKRAGIRVIMVTGDHKRTAAAIARNVGIIEEGAEQDGPVALSEKDIADKNDKELRESIRNVSVFARVTPNTKLRVAELLQKGGALIAMTGDGVNDAPALKKADVGIAMGQKGTDVAKDAAQIVLSDDNFASIVKAIREGRIVFKNVKTTSYFLLTTNFASTSTLIVALLMGFPVPLTAVQILWVNMITDGIMDVAKATEPGHGDMMDRPPIKKDEPILKWEVGPYLLIMAAIMVTLAIFAFDYYLPQGTAMARTGAFFIIASTQIFNVFNMRDLHKSVFEIGLLSNKWINRAFILSFALQVAVVKVPWLQQLFGFDDVPYLDLLIIILVSTSVLWAGELYKYIHRKHNNDQK